MHDQLDGRRCARWPAALGHSQGTPVPQVHGDLPERVVRGADLRPLQGNGSLAAGRAGAVAYGRPPPVAAFAAIPEAACAGAPAGDNRRLLEDTT
jgi:hypothetical protein